MTYAPRRDRSDGAPASGERAGSRRALGCAFEIVETLVLTLLIYLVIHNFVAQPFEVQQSSMVPTIVDGEYILIDKLTPRFDGYHYGDVVVFNPPSGSGLERRASRSSSASSACRATRSASRTGASSSRGRAPARSGSRSPTSCRMQDGSTAADHLPASRLPADVDRAARPSTS